VLMYFCQSSINAISCFFNPKTGEIVSESIKNEFAIMARQKLNRYVDYKLPFIHAAFNAHIVFTFWYHRMNNGKHSSRRDKHSTANKSDIQAAKYKVINWKVFNGSNIRLYQGTAACMLCDQ